MVVFSVYAVKDSIRQRRLNASVKLILSYWICWIAYFVFFLIPHDIGIGTGIFSKYDIFMSEHSIISTIFGTARFYLGLYVCVTPLAALVYIVIKQLKRNPTQSGF
jgi:hypothetical protein